MPQTLAYLRVSSDRQDLTHQRLEILEYARRERLHVDEFLELASSSRQERRNRKIEEILTRLVAGDTLIVTELSRLGRSTGEVITLINELLARQVAVRVIKQNLHLAHQQTDMQSKIVITLLSLFAELERDLISLRTREALAAKKAQGISLGKPKGTLQRSMYDKDRQRIVELLNLGLSIPKISQRHLGYGHPSSLYHYIQTRGLRQIEK